MRLKEVSMKKVLQTISKNLLENTYAAFAGLRPVNLSKTALAQVSSCKFCKVFKKTFFKKTPPVIASGIHYALETMGFIPKKQLILQLQF